MYLIHFEFNILTFSVTLVDGSRSYTEGVGAFNAKPFLSLSSVLYIPKFTFNLLYVS